MSADNEDRGDAIFRMIACGLYLMSALLVGVLILWVYQIVRVGGSVSRAWQLVITYGWGSAAFVMITTIGAALCFLAATSILNAGRRKE